MKGSVMVNVSFYTDMSEILRAFDSLSNYRKTCKYFNYHVKRGSVYEMADVF